MKYKIHMTLVALFGVLGLSLPDAVLAQELEAAVSKSHLYSCVPYIEHPQAKGRMAYFLRSTWDRRRGTFQCFYDLGKDIEYKAPEGRLVIKDPVKANGCRYNPDKSALHCEGKST